MSLRLSGMALFAALSLSACANAPEIAWQPRSDANLVTDKAVCTRTADDVDITDAKQFTDGRYGALAALTAKIDDDSLHGGAVDRMRDAIFSDCMVRKGWALK